MKFETRNKITKRREFSEIVEEAQNRFIRKLHFLTDDWQITERLARNNIDFRDFFLYEEILTGEEYCDTEGIYKDITEAIEETYNEYNEDIFEGILECFVIAVCYAYDYFEKEVIKLNTKINVEENSIYNYDFIVE